MLVHVIDVVRHGRVALPRNRARCFYPQMSQVDADEGHGPRGGWLGEPPFRSSGCGNLKNPVTPVILSKIGDGWGQSER